MSKEKCHSQAQKGDEVLPVSLDFHGSFHNVLIFVSNFRGKSQTEKDPKIKTKKKIAVATEKDTGSPYSQPSMALRWLRKMNPTEVTLL